MKKCDECSKIVICVSCGSILCKPTNDNCYINGHYKCPVVGVVCIKCEKKVKLEIKATC